MVRCTVRPSIQGVYGFSSVYVTRKHVIFFTDISRVYQKINFLAGAEFGPLEGALATSSGPLPPPKPGTAQSILVFRVLIPVIQYQIIETNEKQIHQKFLIFSF